MTQILAKSFWYKVVIVCCLLTFICHLPSAQDEKKVPEISVKTVDGEEYRPSLDRPHIVFFFDAATTENTPLLQNLNRLAYAFRSQKLQITAIYSDLEALAAEDLKKLHDDLSLRFPLYLDIGRQAIKKLNMQVAPALLIHDQQGNICYRATDNIEYQTLRSYAEVALGYQSPDAISEIPPLPAFLTTIEEPLADTEQTPKPAKEKTSKQPVDNKQPPENVTTEKEPKDTGQPKTDNGSKSDPLAKQASSPQKPATGGTESVAPVLAAIVTPQTLGYKTVTSTQALQPEDTLFFLLLELWIKILPLFIWGWGLLYSLSKMKEYRGMLYGFVGCGGFLTFHVWHLCTQIPYQFCIISPHLWQIKTKAIVAEQWFSQLIPSASPLWQSETVFILLFQCALVIGIAGRFKEEKVLA